MRLAFTIAVAAVSVLTIAGGAAQAQNAPKKAAPRSAGGDCQTELKPTDGFRELSAALKCLNDRIKALEASRSTGSASAPPGRAQIAPPPASEGAKIVQNDSLRIELSHCMWAQRDANSLVCTFHLTNLTKEDNKVCFGDGSRLVTDKGASFSNVNGYHATVGSVQNNIYKGTSPLCDSVPPMSKVQASVTFFRARDQTTGEIQFLRVDCGSGCTYEAYKIPIK